MEIARLRLGGRRCCPVLRVVILIATLTSSVLALAIISERSTRWLEALGGEFFEIDGVHYVAVSNRVPAIPGPVSENTDSHIYQWTGTRFAEFQRIPTSTARGWEHFEINGEHYLVVANWYNGTSYNLDSLIYRWTGASFAEFQRIPTSGAADWEHFEINGEHYLVVANWHSGTSYNLDSLIYRWTGDSFAEFQRIPSSGAADWEHFEINGEHYLVVADRLDFDSQIYRWTGASFAEFQRIPTSGAVDWEHFDINGEHYLVVLNSPIAKSFQSDSKIYRWVGASFAEFQHISTGNAVDWEHVDINGAHYLVVVSGFGNMEVEQSMNMRTYRWTGASFAESQLARVSLLARKNEICGLKHFNINGAHYMTVFARHGTSRIHDMFDVNSNIYQWTGDSFHALSSNNSFLFILVCAVVVTMLVQLACCFLLRRCGLRLRRLCWLSLQNVAVGEGAAGGSQNNGLDDDDDDYDGDAARLESKLTAEGLRVAEQRFQDALAAGGVQWLGFCTCLLALGISASVAYSMVWNYIQKGLAPATGSSMFKYGLIWLLILGALWAVCRFGFKRKGARRFRVRRALLCLPIPLIFASALVADKNCRRVLFGSDDGWNKPSHGNLFSLMTANSFAILLVSPASPGGYIAIAFGLLYAVLMVLSYWENPLAFDRGSVNVWYQYFLGLGVLVTFLVIRRMQDGLRRKLALAMQLQSMAVVQEKVRRCQAEFRYEAVKDESARPARQPLNAEPRAPSIATSQSRSAMTAPAATWAFLDRRGTHEPFTASPVASCAGPDCLPENSLVQVEGSTEPQELGSVQVGDRVLCSDCLSYRTCYVEVVGAEVVDDADDIAVGWMKLRLSDGTSITMTEDHPLRVSGRDGRDCVKLAVKVQPRIDKMMCLRLVQTNIVAVERSVTPAPVIHGDGAQGPPRRVSLTVQQGTRFSVLVSPPGSSASLSNLAAVGSADAIVGGLSVRNSVLDFDGQQPPELRRTISDSELACAGGGAAASPPLRPKHGLRRTCDGGGGGGRTDATPGSTAAGGMLPGGCGSSSARGEANIDHIVVELNEAARHKIFHLVLDHHQELRLDLGEYWSRGSRLHTSGDCVLCPSFMLKAGCASGQDCDMCHIPHTDRAASRPNGVKRQHLYQFSTLMRGIFHRSQDSQTIQQAVRRWADEDPRFRRLLQDHAAAILEAARFGSAAAASSSLRMPPPPPAAAPGSSGGTATTAASPTCQPPSGGLLSL